MPVRSVVTVAGKRYGLRRMVGQVCWSVAKSAEPLAARGCGHIGKPDFVRLRAVSDVRTSWSVGNLVQLDLLGSVSCIKLEVPLCVVIIVIVASPSVEYLPSYLLAWLVVAVAVAVAVAAAAAAAVVAVAVAVAVGSYSYASLRQAFAVCSWRKRW